MTITYRVKPGTPAQDAFDRLKAQAVAFVEHVRDWIEAQGVGSAKGYFVLNAHLAGLSFEGDPPEGWVEGEKPGYYRPSLRSKAGKAAWDDALSVRGVDGFEVNLAFFGVDWVAKHQKIYWAGYEEHAGLAYVVAGEAHLEAGSPVEGLEEVSTGELLALRATAGAASEA